MTAEARPWLPANAVRDATLGKLITEHARGWAARWFTDPKPASVRMSEVGAYACMPREAACWETEGSALRLAADELSQLTMAGWMLGVVTGTRKLSVSDRGLFCDLARRCAEDFLRGAASLFLAPPRAQPTTGSRPAPGLRFTVSLGAATQILDLYVAEPAAIAARRAVLTRTTATTELGSRATAIARQPIEVSAMIGVGALALSEFRGLSPGDVLVLDRGLDDTVQLAINGQVRNTLPCHIRRDGDALTLSPALHHNGGMS